MSVAVPQHHLAHVAKMKSTAMEDVSTTMSDAMAAKTVRTVWMSRVAHLFPRPAKSYSVPTVVASDIRSDVTEGTTVPMDTTSRAVRANRMNSLAEMVLAYPLTSGATNAQNVPMDLMSETVLAQATNSVAILANVSIELAVVINASIVPMDQMKEVACR